MSKAVLNMLASFPHKSHGLDDAVHLLAYRARAWRVNDNRYSAIAERCHRPISWPNHHIRALIETKSQEKRSSPWTL
jgi:hypothetical protein